jgi:transposase
VRLYFRLHPAENIATVQVIAFLGQLQHHLRQPLAVVWDRLLAHWAKKTRAYIGAAPVLHVAYLPPYAPELNPVEYLWSYLKGPVLANFAPLELVQLTNAARGKSRSIQRQPKLLRSFIKHSPLPLRLR